MEVLILVFRNLKRLKAPGPDQITYVQLIFGDERVVQAVVKLLNTIVLRGRITYFWKRRFIITLFKEGDKSKTLCTVL